MVYGVCGGVGAKHVAAGEGRKDHSYRDSLSRMDGHRGHWHGAHRHPGIQGAREFLAAVLYFHIDCVRDRA